MNPRKNLFQGRNYLINIATLVSGTAISQAILVSATPLLTRLYTPGEFGAFALYLSIVAIISSVASWKFELAIMLPKEEKDAQALLFLSSIICILTSLFVFLIILLFKQFIIDHITDKIESFIWILPLGVLFFGHFQILYNYSSRRKYYRNISVTRVSQSTLSVATQLGSKALLHYSGGLIIGNLLGRILSVMILTINLIRNRVIDIKNLNDESMIKNARQYNKFPRYHLFSSFLNALAQNLPVLLLTFLYNPEIAGFYALTHRILAVPMILVGESTRQVYYQKASAMYSQGKSIWQLFRQTTIGLLKLGVLPFILLGIFAPFLFVMVFGADWVTSGKYVQLIILWSFTAFLNPPTMSSIFILGMQKQYMLYEITITVMRFLAIYVPFILFKNHYYSVFGFGIVGFILNALLILYIGKLLQKNNKTNEEKVTP